MRAWLGSFTCLEEPYGLQMSWDEGRPVSATRHYLVDDDRLFRVGTRRSLRPEQGPFLARPGSSLPRSESPQLDATRPPGGPRSGPLSHAPGRLRGEGEVASPFPRLAWPHTRAAALTGNFHLAKSAPFRASFWRTPERNPHRSGDRCFSRMILRLPEPSSRALPASLQPFSGRSHWPCRYPQSSPDAASGTF
jgi:hypothetical protein